jgi:DNA polymerase I-like protein with 3'-5' exonuclease and polymerase domains
VLNFHPSYILRKQDEKGGGAERIEQTWINAWEKVDELISGGDMPELPETVSLTDPGEVRSLLNFMINMPESVPVVYDYETWGDKTALRPELCNNFQILSIGVAFDTDEGPFAVSFPFDDRRSDVWRHNIIEILWVKLLSQERPFVAQNSKYEHKCNIKRFDKTWPMHDTMLRMNLIDERVSASLGAIANRVGLKWAYYKADMHDAQVDPSSTPLDKLLRYNGLDALCTLECVRSLNDSINQDGLNRAAVLSERYAYHLAYVEMNGYHIDKDRLDVVRTQIRKDIVDATARFRSHKIVKKCEEWNAANIKKCKPGDPFNPSSSTQMQHLCLQELRLPIVADRDGKYKCDKRVLERFSAKHPVIDDLLAVRSLSAMQTGFLDKWEQYVGPTGCVHTSYLQTEVVTGRLSSRDPNLTNIPKDSPVRSVFTSRYKDGVIINGDFNQLEPRILAGWSGDEGLCYALENGFDLHLFVTASIYGLEYEDMYKRYKAGDADAAKKRDLGKRMNLGNMYGQTEYGLAQKANITESEASELLDMYNQRFPGVEELRTEFKKHALKHGWVEDLMGRRRHLPKVKSSNQWEANRALRQAGNAPIQSSGNQMCLLSLCVCQTMLGAASVRAVVAGPVHDSITLDCHPKDVEKVREILKTAMEIHNGAEYWYDKKVSITAKITVGPNLIDQQ